MTKILYFHYYSKVFQLFSSILIILIYFAGYPTLQCYKNNSTVHQSSTIIINIKLNA